MHIQHLIIPISSLVSERHSLIDGANALAPSAPMLLDAMHIHHLMLQIESVVSALHPWIADASALAPSAPM